MMIYKSVSISHFLSSYNLNEMKSRFSFSESTAKLLILILIIVYGFDSRSPERINSFSCDDKGNNLHGELEKIFVNKTDPSEYDKWMRPPSTGNMIWNKLVL